MVGHAHAIPLELVGSLLEVMDLTWNVLEHRREVKEAKEGEGEGEEIAHLRSENLRLRSVLANNLSLLYNVYNSPSVSEDCSPDLQNRLVAAIEDSSFLSKLESVHRESMPCGALASDSKGGDLDGVEVVINVDNGEPSLWVLVTHDVTPVCVEEASGIDNDNYVIVSEENVVEGISNFIARCILENPKSKNLSPEELQKAVTRSLGGIKDRRKWKNLWEAGKVIYTLSTWGIALAGLYRHRAIIKAAAKGVHASTKVVLKVL